MKLIIISIFAILFIATSTIAGEYGKENHENNIHISVKDNQNLISYLETIASEKLDDMEIEALTYMIEEEKLARDVYSMLSQHWGIIVFQNISASEQIHMNAISYLLDRYGIENPGNSYEIASFGNEEIQSLYLSLVEKGSAGIIEALYVGATIEELDIYDLQQRFFMTDNEDMKAVFQNLMKGSRNHLRSFASLLKKSGFEYEAQYLIQEEVDDIIFSDRERGIVDADGIPVSLNNRF